MKLHLPPGNPVSVRGVEKKYEKKAVGAIDVSEGITLVQKRIMRKSRSKLVIAKVH